MCVGALTTYWPLWKVEDSAGLNELVLDRIQMKGVREANAHVAPISCFCKGDIRFAE